MTARTVLIACGALAREVLALKEKHGWQVDVQAVPALLHNTPPRIVTAVAKRIAALRSQYERLIVVYGDCGTAGQLDAVLAAANAVRVAGPHCYEMYADGRFAEMMSAEPGTYFLTDYLVRSFDHLVIAGLGLDKYPELRNAYFKNYRRIVYLAQRPDDTLVTKARDAAAYLDLPLEIHNLGYGALETRLLALLTTEKA